MRCKTINTLYAELVNIHRFPNFSASGSITGMKKLYYGKDALLVRYKGFIYNVTSEPEIYYNATK